MISKLILRKFKRFDEETFLFNNFDLIVGTNNSGKSTVLQSLAIWQYCVDQFSYTGKRGKVGIQIVLPNFTALPVPEFNLLWKDRTDRRYQGNPEKHGKRDQIYIPIEIDVYWKNDNGIEKNFCVQLSYGSPQTLYARPLNGWDEFYQLNETGEMPHIIYVPPFSGLEPDEEFREEGNVRQQIGKAQPGSVLRNLLYRVSSDDWVKIKNCISAWFNVELQEPKYDRRFDPKITVEYKANKKSYDIISGGSGFHQILTLLAFMYGWKRTTTILFDEPDAHLHVNLQRQILDYLKKNTHFQFLIATHSEVFIEKVEIDSIISLLSGKPLRVPSSREIIAALDDVDNIDVVRTQDKDHQFILYLEGEDDNRILSAWATTLNKGDVYQRFYPYFMRGSTKKAMMDKANSHYVALKKFVPYLKQAILVDYDNDAVALNPPSDQAVCNEWKRKNIDNYLLVPDAWKRAVENKGDNNITGLFRKPYDDVVDSFFTKQGLVLMGGSSWKNTTMPAFKYVDGKKILFKDEDSLFQQIKGVNNAQLIINRSSVAEAMTKDEIHEDIVQFFDNLTTIVETSRIHDED
jgi:predicted ATPase